jgi:hypothetical protein
MLGPVEGFIISIAAIAIGFLALWGLSKLLDRLVNWIFFPK